MNTISATILAAKDNYHPSAGATMTAEVLFLIAFVAVLVGIGAFIDHKVKQHRNKTTAA